MLAEYDRAMVATGIYNGRQVAAPGKEGQMEDYGWTDTRPAASRSRRARICARCCIGRALRSSKRPTKVVFPSND